MSIENTTDAQTDMLGNEQPLLAELLDLKPEDPKPQGPGAPREKVPAKPPGPGAPPKLGDIFNGIIPNRPFNLAADAEDQLLEEALERELELRTLNWDRDKSPLYSIRKPPPTTKTDQELVKQLGAPRWQDRNDAEIILDSRGQAALPALRSGTESTDPEINYRAKRLIEGFGFQGLRQVLASGKDLIKIDEALRADRPLPANWSDLCNKFLEQAKKIDLSLVSKLENRIDSEDELFKKFNLWYKDFARLAEIGKHPEMELSELLLLNRGEANPEKQHAKMEKVAELLSEELKKGRSIFDPELLFYAQVSNSMTNKLFFNAWREGLIKTAPRYQTANDEQIHGRFAKPFK